MAGLLEPDVGKVGNSEEEDNNGENDDGDDSNAGKWDMDSRRVGIEAD